MNWIYHLMAAIPANSSVGVLSDRADKRQQLWLPLQYFTQSVELLLIQSASPCYIVAKSSGHAVANNHNGTYSRENVGF